MNNSQDNVNVSNKMKTSPPRTPIVRTRLNQADYVKFTLYCRAEGKTATELARQALIEFLDRKERGLIASAESIVEKRLKKLEDRLVKLQIKTAIDVGTIFLLMYRHMDLDERDKAVAWAYSGSIKRLRNKLTEPQAQLTDLVKADDQVNSQA